MEKSAADLYVELLLCYWNGRIIYNLYDIVIDFFFQLHYFIYIKNHFADCRMTRTRNSFNFWWDIHMEKNSFT